MLFSPDRIASLGTLLAFWALKASAVIDIEQMIPGLPCSCSSGFVPVPVDVTIPVDPSTPEGLNSTDTMRLRTTFDVYGTLCEPLSLKSKTNHAVQLLLHGQTYNTQYWDVTWGGFQNYSFVAYSCSRGVTSFAYDNVGSGRTIRQHSTHAQLPTAANVSASIARDLKSGRVSHILTGHAKKYTKVVGIGHSLGSSTLNYAVIGEGSRSPFDGLILTGSIHDPAFQHQYPVTALPASEINAGRWAELDPGYISTPNITARSLYYGPDNGTSYSPRILQLDELTKDAGSKWMSLQIPFIYSPAFGFRAPVVELVGSLDQVHCLTDGAPCDQAKLQASEAIYFPDSRNFTMIVLDGCGHDVNYQYAAADAIPLLNRLFESFVH